MITTTVPMNADDQPGDPLVSKLLRRRDMDLRFDIVPEQKEFGSQRGMYTAIKGTNCSAQIAVILFGQKTPPHSNTAEHIICHFSGDVEWTVAGQKFRLDTQGDMLFIPANAEYSYANRGDDKAFFMAMLGKREAWPPRGNY